MWFPEYFTPTKKKTPFGVENVECNDCPKSFATQQSKEFIRIHQRVKRANEMGIQILAPGTVDARTVDALIVIEREEERIQNARIETENLERD